MGSVYFFDISTRSPRKSTSNLANSQKRPFFAKKCMTDVVGVRGVYDLEMKYRCKSEANTCPEHTHVVSSAASDFFERSE